MKKWLMLFCVAGVMLLLSTCPLSVLLIYQNNVMSNSVFEVGDASISRADNWLALLGKSEKGDVLSIIKWFVKKEIKGNESTFKEGDYLFSIVNGCKKTGTILFVEMTLDEQKIIEDKITKLMLEGGEGAGESISFSLTKLGSWHALLARSANGNITIFVPELRFEMWLDNKNLGVIDNINVSKRSPDGMQD